MPDALQVQDLRKSYGARLAVADVSLRVRAGEVLGLRGPNGAGKSTAVRMISGLTVADAGSVTVGGATLASDEFASSAASAWCRKTSRCSKTCRRWPTSNSAARSTTCRRRR